MRKYICIIDLFFDSSFRCPNDWSDILSGDILGRMGRGGKGGVINLEYGKFN